MPKTKTASKSNAVKQGAAGADIPATDERELNLPPHLEIEEAFGDDVERMSSYEAENILGVPHGLNTRSY